MLKEADRLENLRSYDILDSIDDASFDQLVKLASMICGTSMAMICFVDENRLWLKATAGFEGYKELPRNQTFCTEAIKGQELLEIPDATKHPVFKDYPYVLSGGVSFYAGHPLRSKEGHNLGVICVFDKNPSKLNLAQKEALESLSKQVIELTELRKMNTDLTLAKKRIEDQQELLINKARLQTVGELAGGVCHQINNPLAIIVGRAMILRSLLKQKLPADQELFKELDLIDQTSSRVSTILKSLRVYAKDLGTNKTYSSLNEVLDDAMTLIRGKLVDSQVKFQYEKSDDHQLYMNKNQVSQVFLDLLNNAIEALEESTVKNISLAVEGDDQQVTITISDSGKGVRPEEEAKIFEPFFTTKTRHFGIGLSNAKNFIAQNKGEILLISRKNPTIFQIKFSKT